MSIRRCSRRLPSVVSSHVKASAIQQSTSTPRVTVDERPRQRSRHPRTEHRDHSCPSSGLSVPEALDRIINDTQTVTDVTRYWISRAEDRFTNERRTLKRSSNRQSRSTCRRFPAEVTEHVPGLLPSPTTAQSPMGRPGFRYRRIYRFRLPWWNFHSGLSNRSIPASGSGEPAAPLKVARSLSGEFRSPKPEHDTTAVPGFRHDASSARRPQAALPCGGVTTTGQCHVRRNYRIIYNAMLEIRHYAAEGASIMMHASDGRCGSARDQRRISR